MTQTITVANIKWAFSKKLDTNLHAMEGFLDNLCLFVGEILRTDEIGLIVWRDQPILMLRIYKVDLETEANYIERIYFKDSGLKEMLTSINSAIKPPSIICCGFEIFCYRPKRDEPYHPKIYPTYIRAREKASRVLHAIYMIIALDMSPCLSYAQVDEKAYTKFFKKTSDQDEYEDKIKKFGLAVDSWIQEFYTSEIGSKQYKTKNRYPLAPKPLEGCDLNVITSDDDGNIICYKTNV